MITPLRRSAATTGLALALATVGIAPLAVAGPSDPADVPGLRPDARTGPIAAEECRPSDRPEPGLQGEVPLVDQQTGTSQLGYSCNLSVVTTSSIGGRGGDTQMTYFDRCAYRSTPGANGDELAVFDLTEVDGVADTAELEPVQIIDNPFWHGKGSILGIHEGIDVAPAAARLVVPIEYGISVYDLSADCTQPVRVGDFPFEAMAGDDPTHDRALFQAAGIHSGRLSTDGTWYFATDISNGATAPNGPCLNIIDLDPDGDGSVSVEDPPRFAGTFGDEFPCHDLDVGPDDDRAYVGFYEAAVGHPSAVVGAFTPAGQPAALASGLRIVDISSLTHGAPVGDLPIVGELTGGGNHTEVLTRIGDRDYVISAEEGHCPAGNARIIDVTDETQPVLVSHINLEINQPHGCAAAASNPQKSKLLLHMSHYLTVDDPDDASLAFITWYGSGLRVFDISDPTAPVEVAYLNPAVGAGAGSPHDSSTTVPRYDPATGRVTFGAGVNAMVVAELRADLRPGPGPHRDTVDPSTGMVVATPEMLQAAERLSEVAAFVRYCTLTLFSSIV